jgi:hypothetical protein
MELAKGEGEQAMIVQHLVVIVGAIALSGALGWFFLGPRAHDIGHGVGPAFHHFPRAVGRA